MENITPVVKDSMHQINVQYVAKEDRLLMRTTTKNGDEYRVWLTRRFTGLLYDLLNKVMEAYGGAPSIGAAPQTQKLFKSGALEKKFDSEKAVNFPLGKHGILAYEIKSATTPDGILHLELLPEKGKGLNLNLNKSLLYMLHNLLYQGIARAEWHLAGTKEFSDKVH